MFTTHALSRPRTGGRRLGRGHPWLALAAVSLGLMTVMLDATVVSIANPAIGADLHASLSGLQWVTNAYLLAVAVTIVTGGKLGDRFGRKRFFLIGVGGFALASAAVGLSPAIGPLIGFRALQGVFGALLMPATLAIIRATFPERLLQQAIGVWAGISAVALASGPVVGGLLVEHASWRMVFFLNLPVAAAALALGGWVVVESRDEHAATERFDLPGVALLSASLFALVWAIVKAPTLGWGAGMVVGSLAASAVGFVLFVLRERTAEHPLLPLGLFRSRSLSVGVVLVLLLTFALFGIVFFLSLYLQRVHGYSPIQTGVRTLPLTATLVLAAPLGGLLAARVGPRLPLAGGMLLLGLGLLGLSRLEPQSDFWSFAPWLFLLGVALGLLQTASADVIVGNAPVRLGGVAGGLQQTALQVGGALGTAVLGAVVSSRVAMSLPLKLAAEHVPAAAAHAVAAQSALVAQGVPPVDASTPPALAVRIVGASYAAFTHGLDVGFVVAACIAFAGALLALLIRRGASSSDAAAIF